MQQKDRLKSIREQMKQAQIDALLVRSTDAYLNEYVPTDVSTRIWATGFTGSMGEALITLDQAFVAVDGRYWLQADQEVDAELFEVLKVQMGTGLDRAIAEKLFELSDSREAPLKVGYEQEKVTPYLLESLEGWAGEKCEFVPQYPSPISLARGDSSGEAASPGIRTLKEKRFGTTVAEKLAALAQTIEDTGADALILQRLDEIAYLSNLRGTELPFQATFCCVALAAPDRLYLGIDPQKVPEKAVKNRPNITFLPEDKLWALAGKDSALRKIAFDPKNNTEYARAKLEASGAELVAVDAPLQPLRAEKNPTELAAMKDAFRRADLVVEEVISWACKAVSKGKKISEKRFAEEVERRFIAAGAVGLSFKVISAAGENGASIHYSDPNPKRYLKVGEMMLLDTGGYFKEGYATDLTRTFLVGNKKTKATAEQKRIYTLVLKSAIAGMTAVLPVGSRGDQLDAICRAPIWRAGLNFNHGTGHGVGINVHESPPRVAPGSKAVLKPGHVFSIEPGLYIPGFGGVRIENLATVEESPAGFLKVVPLTFSPLDERLIDRKMLNPEEKAFLKWFAAQHSA